jgi:hypothetical protein
VKPKSKRGSQSALHRTLLTLLLVIGSAAPVAIAFFLVASISDENPLDNIPDYETTFNETLIVPFDRADPTYTEFKYTGRVRVVVEGTGQAAGTAFSDAFYLYTDADGRPLQPPQTEMFDLAIDGQRAIQALGLVDDPTPYNDDHQYAVIYDVGPELRRIAFRISDEVVQDNSGAFTIYVVQLKE